MIENYEEFTEAQRKILGRYVTSCNSNVFALQNLPEVIKGALFSRYSRSSLGLRSLLLKEFILNEETSFASIAQQGGHDEEMQEQQVAIRKAQNFYDRILDGYGDDSIGELGGAHLAIENISMLAAKAIEDARIGGSPLEKSTRYIYFDQKVNGEYLFYREPILMTSAYRELFVGTCNKLFDTYVQLIAPVTELIEKRFPKEHDISKAAYAAALRAKVLDCLRGLLPASALTNMGLYGNGRFFETLLQKMSTENLSELQELAKKGVCELEKVIPSFIRRAKVGHKYQSSYATFQEQMRAELASLQEAHTKGLGALEHAGVRLIGYDGEGPIKVAAALLFPGGQAGLYELQNYCRTLSDEELARILEAGANFRENRRHKSPRALEHASFTFEIVGDFGMYRDLHRHRMLTQERKLLTCNLGYYIPHEIQDTAMAPLYIKAMEEAKRAFDEIAAEFPEEAQYVVPMAYNIHWYFHINLRALQWLCELRSSPAGHPNYRFVAQEMAKEVGQVLPQFERFFRFVDYDGYELGRLGQEIRIVQKMEARVAHEL